MKVFRASLRQSWRFGGFLDEEYIIVANIESEALGLAMEANQSSNSKDWEIEEIDTTVTNVTETYSHGN